MKYRIKDIFNGYNHSYVAQKRHWCGIWGNISVEYFGHKALEKALYDIQGDLQSDLVVRYIEVLS